MKFRIQQAGKLYKALRQVYDTTPRYEKKHEVALELTEGGELILYRDSSTAYCEYRLEADLIGQEPGKVIIANGSRLEFVSGIHEVIAESSVVRLNNLATGEYTELPVSSTDPSFYVIADASNLEFIDLPENFQNTIWCARQSGNPLAEFVHFLPTMIGTHEGSIMACFLNCELPLDEAIALPSDFDLSGVKKVAFDKAKVWFRGDNFLSYSTANAYHSSLKEIGSAYDRLNDKVLTSLSGKRDELLALFSVMDKIAQVDSLNLAITTLSLFSDELQLTSLETGGVRKLKVAHTGEIVSERIRPRQFASALSSLIDDEVSISQISNGGTGYLWVIRDSRIVNLIAALDRSAM